MNALNAYSAFASFSAKIAYGGANGAGAGAVAQSSGAGAAPAANGAPAQAAAVEAACTVEISAEARLAAATAAAAPAEQTMEEFKQAFWDKLSQIPCSGMQGTSITINISEAGWAAMKADPEYEGKILGLFARDLQNPYYPQMRGGNVEFTVGASAEDYCARSWGAEYDFNKTKKDDDEGESIWEMIWRRHREFVEMQKEAVLKEKIMGAAGESGAENLAPAGTAPAGGNAARAPAGQAQRLHFTSVDKGFNFARAVVA